MVLEEPGILLKFRFFQELNHSQQFVGDNSRLHIYNWRARAALRRSNEAKTAAKNRDRRIIKKSCSTRATALRAEGRAVLLNVAEALRPR